MMLNAQSVTQWIEDLKKGDEDAAAQLWERYFEKMVIAARNKLKSHSLAVADEEDVALSAFDSLCRGALKGNFGQLKNRHELWPLLLTITAQKSIDRIRFENRQRRGGDTNVLRDGDLQATDQMTTINGILSTGPTPAFLVLMDEQHKRLLSLLRDDTLRDIVKWKLESQTNEEIAQFLGISIHTVGRKLRMIRLAWSQELDT